MFKKSKKEVAPKAKTEKLNAKELGNVVGGAGASAPATPVTPNPSDRAGVMVYVGGL